MTFLRKPRLDLFAASALPEDLGHFLPRDCLPSYVHSLGCRPSIDALLLVLSSLTQVFDQTFTDNFRTSASCGDASSYPTLCLLYLNSALWVLL